MKKLIKKADEMEMAINLKASRYAFGFLEIAIMIYCIVERVITGEFPSTIFIFGVFAFCGARRNQMRFRADILRSKTDAPKLVKI